MAGKLITRTIPSFLQDSSQKHKRVKFDFTVFFFTENWSQRTVGCMIYCIVDKQLGGKRWEDMGRAIQWSAGMVGNL
jgi:hypothetical protein